MSPSNSQDQIRSGSPKSGNVSKKAAKLRPLPPPKNPAKSLVD